MQWLHGVQNVGMPTERCHPGTLGQAIGVVLCVESQPKQPDQDLLARAVISGSSASVLSGIALSVCSKLEEGSAAGALNGPSQWVWGEHEAYTRRATLKHTLVGYAIHHAMSIAWAVWYEHLFGRRRERERSPTWALGMAAEVSTTALVAYFVDYFVAPKRLRPGFKKHLGNASIFASYAAFGAGLAIATILRRKLKQKDEQRLDNQRDGRTAISLRDN